MDHHKDNVLFLLVQNSTFPWTIEETKHDAQTSHLGIAVGP